MYIVKHTAVANNIGRYKSHYYYHYYIRQLCLVKGKFRDHTVTGTQKKLVYYLLTHPVFLCEIRLCYPRRLPIQTY